MKVADSGEESRPFVLSYKLGMGTRSGFKPEGLRFGSRCCHWHFFIDIILAAALWPLVWRRL
jgi:hypothetical protein